MSFTNFFFFTHLIKVSRLSEHFQAYVVDAELESYKNYNYKLIRIQKFYQISIHK